MRNLAATAVDARIVGAHLAETLATSIAPDLSP